MTTQRQRSVHVLVKLHRHVALSFIAVPGYCEHTRSISKSILLRYAQLRTRSACARGTLVPLTALQWAILKNDLGSGSFVACGVHTFIES
eukprot:4769057-Pleurochrysis_carterae.AAC.3